MNMNIWEKIRVLRDCLYCSRILQVMLPGGGKDKIGKKLVRGKLWKDAEDHYEQALRLFPERILFRERAAIAKLNQGKYADAEAVFAKLLARYPGVSRFALYLAQSLHGRGLKNEAIDVLERYLQYSPNSARVLKNLGKMHLDAGNWNKGKEYFLRCADRKKQDDSFYEDFFAQCYMHDDIALIKSVKCSTYIKEYFLKYYYMNERMRLELFGGGIFR